MKQLDCNIIIVPSERLPVIELILEAYLATILQIPRLAELLKIDHPNCKYKLIFEQTKDDPLVVLHTSGTTKLQKPLI